MIEAIEGVVFFFSSISGVCSNANCRRDPNSQPRKRDTYPCVSFFIVFELNERCNDETFFLALHNEDVEPEITPINVRTQGKQDWETAARQLFQTVKDHSNPTMQEMVDVSNMYCYRNAPASSSDTNDEDKDKYDEFQPTHFLTVPCCFVIVSHSCYLQEFEMLYNKFSPTVS